MTRVIETVLQMGCQQPWKSRGLGSSFNNRRLDQQKRAGEKYKMICFPLNIWWNLNILRDTLVAGEHDQRFPYRFHDALNIFLSFFRESLRPLTLGDLSLRYFVSPL
jgi:hypothetical protein